MIDEKCNCTFIPHQGNTGYFIVLKQVEEGHVKCPTLPGGRGFHQSSCQSTSSAREGDNGAEHLFDKTWYIMSS